MKAVVSLLLLCLLQNLAKEQEEVEAVGAEGGGLQAAGLRGLLVRENREVKRRNRNGKEGSDRKTGKRHEKNQHVKKTEGRKKATEKNNKSQNRQNKQTRKGKNAKNPKKTNRSNAKKQNGRKGNQYKKPQGNPDAAMDENYEEDEDNDGFMGEVGARDGLKRDLKLISFPPKSPEESSALVVNGSSGSSRARYMIKSCEFVDLTRLGELCITGQKIKYYKEKTSPRPRHSIFHDGGSGHVILAVHIGPQWYCCDSVSDVTELMAQTCTFGRDCPADYVPIVPTN